MPLQRLRTKPQDLPRDLRRPWTAFKWDSQQLLELAARQALDIAKEQAPNHPQTSANVIKLATKLLKQTN